VVRLHAQAPRGPVAPVPLATAQRVLVVDDNVDAARMMAVMLSSVGHEVRVEHRGETALTAAHEFRPDAVLLDIGLPDLDGYAVARRLRANPEFQHVLLVAVTGYGRDYDWRMSRAAGCDEHFIKPVDPQALAALITRRAARVGPLASAGVSPMPED
jgi:CheY-like chemotaxis protein